MHRIRNAGNYSGSTPSESTNSYGYDMTQPTMKQLMEAAGFSFDENDEDMVAAVHDAYSSFDVYFKDDVLELPHLWEPPNAGDFTVTAVDQGNHAIGDVKYDSETRVMVLTIDMQEVMRSYIARFYAYARKAGATPEMIKSGAAITLKATIKVEE